MPAYTIFTISVSNPTRYADYAKHTPRIIAQYGGRMIVRGGAPELTEGQMSGDRIVVLEFPDRAAAKKFMHSPEYQAIVGIRKEASVTSLGVIVDGFPGESWNAAVSESQKHS